MSAVALALDSKAAHARLVAQRKARVSAPCPYCYRILSVPRRYNAVSFCPRAKRMAVGLPPNAPRFTLVDGHRMTTVDVRKTHRPRSGIFARLRAALSSAWTAWKATR